MRANCEPVKGSEKKPPDFSGDRSAERVRRKWRAYLEAAGPAATSNIISIGIRDLTEIPVADLLTGFDAVEQCRNVIDDLDRVIFLVTDSDYTPRRHFCNAPKKRERFETTVRSAVHLYTALSASTLSRRAFECVLGHSYGQLCDLVCKGIEILDEIAAAEVPS